MIDYKKFLKKDFVNKYKLLCTECEFTVKVFSQLENKPYISKIKIEEV